MNDTPEHIRQLQHKLWMSRTPEERLLQFLTDNEVMWNALNKAKHQMKAKNGKQSQDKK
jgi:hypothetical protein